MKLIGRQSTKGEPAGKWNDIQSAMRCRIVEMQGRILGLILHAPRQTLLKKLGTAGTCLTELRSQELLSRFREYLIIHQTIT